MKFDGKRVLVTGAGKGIGRSLAKKLVECGAETFALSRTKADLDSLKEECSAINVIFCDVTDFSHVESVIKSCGPLDLLVNNAAVLKLEPFLDVTLDAFDRLFNVNVKAQLVVAQVVARGMVERKKGGSIVNVSSKASMRAVQDHTVYCMTKAAMDQMTRNMAQELGKYNIRVNSVNPTVVMTDMAKAGWSDPAKADSMKAKIALGRFAEIEEVVSVIMFLLSEESSMVSGSCIPIDGGTLACL